MLNECLKLSFKDGGKEGNFWTGWKESWTSKASAAFCKAKPYPVEAVETTFLLKQDNDPNHSSKTELLIIWYLGSAHQTNQKKAVGGASRSLEYLKSHSQSLRLWLLQIYKVWGEKILFQISLFVNMKIFTHYVLTSLRTRGTPNYSLWASV